MKTWLPNTPKQSHYREVPQWEILMEQELRFGLDLGQLAICTEKKGLGRLWATIEGGFFMFLGAKKMSYSNRHLNTELVYNDFAPKCTALVPLHLEALFTYRIVWYYAQLFRKGPEIILFIPLYWVGALCIVKCPIVTYFDVKVHPDLWDRSCTQTLRYFQSRPLGGQVQRTRPTENAQLSARW